MKSTPLKSAWVRMLVPVSVALVLNPCLHDVCRATPVSGAVCNAAWAAASWYKTQAAAQNSSQGPAPVSDRSPEQNPVQSYAPARLTFDTDGADEPGIPGAGQGEAAEDGQPVYKTWWFWAAAGGAIILVAILAALGGDSGEDLPDFPDPPGK